VPKDLRPRVAGDRQTRRLPPCRIFGVLAKDAAVAVLLRRGPTRWVEMIRWDTASDTFERGQWFHGRIYERRCDLSPDGALFVYFAAKHSARQALSDYTYSWTAISRPPWFTALSLWPKGDCWDGGGWFESSPTRRGRRRHRLHLNHAWALEPHPKHPVPAGLEIIANKCGRGEDLPIYNDILLVKGWQRDRADEEHGELRAVKGSHVWTKREPRGQLVLRMELESIDFTKPGGPLHFGFALLRASDGALVDVLDAQWADWDRSGRLVFARRGKVFAAREDGCRQPTELADFTSDEPAEIVAPDAATRW
jgi:hypothetical protein